MADSQISELPSDHDINVGLDRGVAVLHDSGRLKYEDAALDRALVLEIVDAVFSVPAPPQKQE